MVIVTIPLIHDANQFDLMHILNVPIIYFDSHNLTVLYDIKYQYIAISETRTQFCVLTETSYQQCVANTDLNFCNFDSAILYVSDFMDDCLLSVLTKMSPVNCKLLISSNYPVATVYHIHNGQWAVTGHDETVFTVMCMNVYSKTVKLLPPLDTITLDKGCAAHAVSLTIPAINIYQSNVIVQTFDVTPIHNMTIYDNHLEILTHASIRIPNTLSQLTTNDVDVNVLMRQLHEHLNLSNFTWSNSKYIYISVIVVSIFILFFLAIIIKFRKTCMLRLCALVRNQRKSHEPARSISSSQPCADTSETCPKQNQPLASGSQPEVQIELENLKKPKSHSVTLHKY